MSKNILISSALNILLFGGALLFTQSFNILIFIGVIYLVPLIYNSTIAKENFSWQLAGLLSGMTTLGYGVFSFIFMRQATFFDFMAGTQTTGAFSIQIQSNLLAVSQFLFVFGINLIAMFITNKLVRSNQYANSQRA